MFNMYREARDKHFLTSEDWKIFKISDFSLRLPSPVETNASEVAPLVPKITKRVMKKRVNCILPPDF